MYNNTAITSRTTPSTTETSAHVNPARILPDGNHPRLDHYDLTNTTPAPTVVSKNQSAVLQNCRDHALNLMTEVGTLPEKHLVRAASYKTGYVGVYQPFANPSRNICVLNEANYGCAAIIPRMSGYELFTNFALDCPVLMMRLCDKEGVESLLLMHVFTTEIDAQVQNLLIELGQRGLTVREAVFSPRADSHTLEALPRLQLSSSGNVRTYTRTAHSAARALLTAEGWAIWSENTPEALTGEFPTAVKSNTGAKIEIQALPQYTVLPGSAPYGTAVIHAAFSKQGDHAVLETYDHESEEIIYEIRNKTKPESAWKFKSKSALQVDLNQDGNQVIVVSEGGELQIHSPNRDCITVSLKNIFFTKACFDSDTGLILAVTDTGIYSIDPKTGYEPKQRLHFGKSQSVDALQTDGLGHVILTIGSKRLLRLNLTTGDAQFVALKIMGSVDSLFLDSTGTTIVLITDAGDHSFHFFDAQTLAVKESRYYGFQREIRAAQFTQNSGMITVDENGEIGTMSW